MEPDDLLVENRVLDREVGIVGIGLSVLFFTRNTNGTEEDGFVGSLLDEVLDQLYSGPVDLRDVVQREWNAVFKNDSRSLFLCKAENLTVTDETLMFRFLS